MSIQKQKTLLLSLDQKIDYKDINNNYNIDMIKTKHT